MKKQYLFFLALIFSACTPQVTVTSEVTVTSTSLPTVTETPAPPTYTATPTEETVTLNGVKLTLGEANADGSVPVTDMRVDGIYTDEQKAEKLIAVDPLAWGFEPGEVELVFVGDYLQIVANGDHSQVLAEWNYGRSELVWNWEVMEKYKGGNPIFDFAKTFDMQGTMPKPDQQKEARSDSALLFDYVYNYPGNYGAYVIQAIYIDNPDDSYKSIVAYLIIRRTNSETRGITDPAIAASGTVNGIVCLIDRETGEVKAMSLHGLKFRIRYWN